MLASLDDINANLDGKVIQADQDNTAAIQISVARIVRAYLSRVVDNATLFSWDTPAHSPEVIREIAGKLIASQLFFAKTTTTTPTMEDRHYAKWLYDRAIELLQQIVSGTIVIPGITETPVENLSNLDFFPIDATDRAFTMNQQF